jgi:hypothetical protein
VLIGGLSSDCDALDGGRLDVGNRGLLRVTIVYFGDEAAHELADPIRFLVHALDDQGLDLDRNDPVPGTGFQVQLAHRELRPADQLGRGPRRASLVRGSDGGDDEAGDRRNEN